MTSGPILGETCFSSGKRFKIMKLPEATAHSGSVQIPYGALWIPHWRSVGWPLFGAFCWDYWYTIGLFACLWLFGRGFGAVAGAWLTTTERYTWCIIGLMSGLGMTSGRYRMIGLIVPIAWVINLRTRMIAQICWIVILIKKTRAQPSAAP